MGADSDTWVAELPKKSGRLILNDTQLLLLLSQLVLHETGGAVTLPQQ